MQERQPWWQSAVPARMLPPEPPQHGPNGRCQRRSRGRSAGVLRWIGALSVAALGYWLLSASPG
ncbi:MAG TPA: hypothetical protein VM491_00420 [Burkholderiaceae bacterium]|nr:hypothetical protein [Burkholderiaceae bacterium]